MSARDVMDRVDELLQGTGTPAAARAMDPALVKVRTYAELQQMAWPPSASDAASTVYYLLTDEGDPGAVRDVISGPRMLRSLRVGVELVRRLGSAIDVATTHYQEQVRLLEDTWEDVRACLEHPNNMQRGTTYWLAANDFAHSNAVVDTDRVSLRGHFTAIYDQVLAAF